LGFDAQGESETKRRSTQIQKKGRVSGGFGRGLGRDEKEKEKLYRDDDEETAVKKKGEGSSVDSSWTRRKAEG